MRYGYARVSTIKQLAGYSMDDQTNLLREAGADEVIQEQYTAKTDDREKFKALLGRLRAKDTLMVCKLDRLARNTEDALRLVRELREVEVKIHILNMGVIDDSPMGMLVYTVLAAFAEFERALIFERTQAGRELARQNPDYREGRKPKYSQKQISHALKLLESHTYREVTERTGISKSTLQRAKRRKGGVQRNSVGA